MKTTFKNFIALFIVMIALTANTHAQTLKMNPKAFKMTIHGTTNVHDFESQVTQASGEITFKNGNEVQAMSVSVPVAGIKGKEKLMDKKTYETFDADKHPNIVFKMTKLNSMKVDGNKINVSVVGNLTMAGQTQQVTLTASGVNDNKGNYTFSGSLPIKMSTYKMKAPTAMLGAMKVGDAITLKYSATFTGEQLSLK